MSGIDAVVPDPDREKLRKSHREMKSKPPPFNNNIELILENPENQRGPTYRRNKIEAIHSAWKIGHDDNWVLWHLKRGGLTEPTAKRLIADALDLATGPPVPTHPKQGEEAK